MPREAPIFVGDPWDDDQVPMGLAPPLAHVHNLGVDLLQREIRLTDEIEEDTGHWFITNLRELERRSQEPVRVLLSTPGGDLAAMFSIHDAIRCSPCPVEVMAYGEVCSAGVLLLACGDSRLVTPSTALMSHESHGGEGDLGFRASRDRMKYREWQHRYWSELMGRYTPQDSSWWKTKTERQAEYWLLGGPAIVEAGLADLVVIQWPTGAPPEGLQKRVISATRSQAEASEH